MLLLFELYFFIVLRMLAVYPQEFLGSGFPSKEFYRFNCISKKNKKFILLVGEAHRI